jgi:uncharacterized protein with PIN domain
MQTARPSGTSLLASPRPLLADEMLGRLTRWLRVLGFDTERAEGLEDGAVLQWALREGRTLLTRDTGMMRRRLVRDREIASVFVRGDRLEEQMTRLVEEHGLARVAPPRCVVCNALLRPAEPSEVVDAVPDYVAATHVLFRHCPTCDRYVWEGTHWENMRALLRRMGVAGA